MRRKRGERLPPVGQGHGVCVTLKETKGMHDGRRNTLPKNKGGEEKKERIRDRIG